MRQQIMRYLGLALVLVAPAADAGAQERFYLLKDIQTLPGVSHPARINNLGHVAGTLWTTAGTFPFFYDGTAMISLGALGATGLPYAEGRGLNDNDQVVGWSTTSWGSGHAFLWQGGVMQDLGTLGGSSVYSEANGINNSGVIVGRSEDGAGGLFAVRWIGGVVGSLGKLPIAWYSGASDINEAGNIVGTSGHGFLWSGGAISDLSPAYPYQCGANSINDAGEIVGSMGYSHAALFQNGACYPLDGGYSVANDINNEGIAVGWRLDWAPGRRAKIYNTRTGKHAVLRDRVLFATGWALEYANSINNTGLIAGSGKAPGGGDHAFILTPLPPGMPSVRLAKTTFVGGETVTGAVEVGAPAPAGGWTVQLVSDRPDVTVPATLLIPEGASGATFMVSSGQVLARARGAIRATFGDVTRSARFTLTPNVLTTLSIAPNPVKGGLPAVASMTLTCPAGPAGVTVTLTSNNPAVAWPAIPTVSFGPGEVTKTVTIGTSPVAVLTRVRFGGSAGDIVRSAGVSVKP